MRLDRFDRHNDRILCHREFVMRFGGLHDLNILLDSSSCVYIMCYDYEKSNT